MGAGYHGGFGSTYGSKPRIGVITLDSFLVGGLRKGKDLADAAKRVTKESDFTDVAVHGTANHIAIFRMEDGIEKSVKLTHRDLARFLKSDKGYTGGNIRLLSCNTGNTNGTFAQDLANKMGVAVRAPSDTLHIWPNGRMIIGPTPYLNSGKWNTFYPQKGKKAER